MKTFDVYRDYFNRMRGPTWLGFVKAETHDEAQANADAVAQRRGEEDDARPDLVQVEEAEEGVEYDDNDEYA